MILGGSKEDFQNPLLKSIDESIHKNIKIRQSESQVDKRMTVREFDKHMKTVIKQHKDTFTFGVPTKYSKLQSNIEGLLHKMDKSADDLTPGYSNQKQKRVYRNELLQESYQNKMGLINKPTIEQLMIGDYIREKKHKVKHNKSHTRCPLPDRLSSAEDGEEPQYETEKRPVSKAKQTESIFKHTESRLTNAVNNLKIKISKKNRSKRRGRLSKIKLRNPATLNSKFEVAHPIDPKIGEENSFNKILKRNIKMFKRERTRAQEDFYSINKNSQSCTRISDNST